MTTIELSSEQAEFLKECEELYKNRYTEYDDEYMEAVEKSLTEPPVIAPWYHRGDHQNDSGRSNRNKRSMEDRSNRPRKHSSHSSHNFYRDY